mgnify:CR=1 FL=1
MNIVAIMGRMTTDPELKTTQSGISVMSFYVAVNRNYTKDGERQTDFINCVAWRNTAEFISKYFSKGQMIAIKGNLQQRNYTDKDGNKRTAYDVVVEQASFCGSKNESSSAQTEHTSFSNVDINDFDEISMNDEDMPF